MSIQLNGNDLTFDQLYAVALQNVPVSLSPAAAERMNASRAVVDRLVASGKSNQDIARELVLATGTVKKHLSNIFGKLDAQNRTQCVARARELNLL